MFGVIAMIGLGIVYQDMRADRARELADRAKETEINATTAEILKRMETRLEAIERRLSDSNCLTYATQGIRFARLRQQPRHS